MNTLTINGQTISFSGGNIQNFNISNGKISINGKDFTMPDEKVINISITGDVNQLQIDSCHKAEVHGHVQSLRTVSGDVVCGNVTNSVQTTSGDVECGSVGGSVSTVSGDVSCEEINGSVSTVSGDVN